MSALTSRALPQSSDVLQTVILRCRSTDLSTTALHVGLDHVFFQSRSISARHAAIEMLPDGDAVPVRTHARTGTLADPLIIHRTSQVIHDLNSLNGTFLNEHRLKGAAPPTVMVRTPWPCQRHIDPLHPL